MWEPFTSHNPVGLHGLLQGYLYFFYFTLHTSSLRDVPLIKLKDNFSFTLVAIMLCKFLQIYCALKRISCPNFKIATAPSPVLQVKTPQLMGHSIGTADAIERGEVLLQSRDREKRRARCTHLCLKSPWAEVSYRLSFSSNSIKRNTVLPS
jgi:hypothetical protein